MGIPLLAAKFAAKTGGPASVVVNRAFADVYFNGASVIGHHVQPVGLGYSGAAEIRAFSGDARESGLDHRRSHCLLVCSSRRTRHLLPGAHRNTPMTMAETIRRHLHNVEPMRSATILLRWNNTTQMRWRKTS